MPTVCTAAGCYYTSLYNMCMPTVCTAAGCVSRASVT